MNYSHEKPRQFLLEEVYVIGYNISGRRNYWEVHLNGRLRINTASVVILGNNIRLR